ncbi:hypothetical protein [Psychromonas aquimarina]|nr:hypothetical protein [Psychromonas aquimarina]
MYFALTLFLPPLEAMIPTAATAPVLMYIGIAASMIYYFYIIAGH